MASKDPEISTADPEKDIETQHQEKTPSPENPDVAVRFLNNLKQEIKDEPITPEESRRLLWKIDLIIIPILAFSVIISAVDKVIISNAAIYGLIKDVHLKDNEFSWVGSIFYFGFLVAEYPGNVLIQKLPIRSFYGATVFGWAVMTFITGATQNFGGLAAVRFLSEFRPPSLHRRNADPKKWACSKPSSSQSAPSSQQCGGQSPSSPSA